MTTPPLDEQASPEIPRVEVQHSEERRPIVGLIVGLCLISIAIVGASYYISYRILDKQLFSQSLLMTRLGAAKDIEMRDWMATFGGIYVPVTEATPPNPYLNPKGREITTPDGVLLTKMNPAYVTRLLHERWSKNFGMVGHITSLKPVRPANAAAPWEKAVLEELARTGQNEYVEQVDEDGVVLTRYMITLKAKPGCLVCHTTQGYKVGDIMGGISNVVPTAKATYEHTNMQQALLWGHLTVAALVVMLIIMGGARLVRRSRERDKAEARLQELAISLEERVRDRTEELRAYMEHSQSILAGTLEGIAEVDRNGRILFINKAGREMTGYNEGDDLSQAFGADVHDIHCGCPLCAAHARNERIRFTGISMRCRDGNVIFTDGSSAPALHGGSGSTILVFHNISEYSRLESLQRLLFEVSGEPFLIFSGRTLSNCNSAAVKFLGAESESELCHNFLAFSPPRQSDGRTTTALMEVYFDECDRNGVVCFTWQHLHRDGTPLPSRITLSRIDHPLHQGYFCSLYDLRASLAYEEKLTADRKLLGDIINASPMPMYIVDHEGLVSVTNPSGETLLGLKPGYDGDMPWPDKKEYFSLLDVARNDGVVSGQRSRLLGQENTMLETRVNVAGVVYEDRKAFLLWIQDISDLVEAMVQAEESSNAKGRFLARMSHEIRTPMNAVLGMTYLLLQNPMEDRQRRYIQKIQTASKGLLGIINDILDFSKIEAGKLTLETAPFSLSELVENLSNVCSPIAEEKKLELLFHVSPDLPDSFEGDALRLTQVLTNLLSNAIKFTEKGEVVLRIRSDGHTDNETTLLIEVADSGIGMTREQMSRLFQSFEQADVSTTRKYGGTGLGLVICDQLVRMMGGEISVSSVMGKGSSFSFSLPLQRQITGDTFTYSGLASHERILVVDDNDTAREVLEDMIGGFGFEVDTVGSGYEACAAVYKAAGENRPYCLALLDWKMPGMDGFECADKLNELPIAAPPQLMMISAYGMEEYNAKGRLLGFMDYISKPVTRSTLWNALAKTLGKEVIAPKGVDLDQIQQELNVGGLRGAEILLVEDNETNQEVAATLLARYGLVVTIADNGQEAVNVCKTRSFDLIFMDIQMPVMDGLEAAGHIRAMESDGETGMPIVAMTAHAMQSDREISLKAGMNDHITKPIDPEALAKVLLKWVRPRTEAEKAAAEQSLIAKEEGGNPAIPAALAALDGMNAEQGLYNVGGVPAAYFKHLRNFPDRYSRYAEQIGEAGEIGSWQDAGRLAHTLKGVGATLGMTAIAACASKLEVQCGDKRIDSADLVELSALLARVCAAVQEAFTETAQPAPVGGVVDIDALTHALKGLPDLLEHDLGKCMSVLSDIKNFVPAALSEGAYKGIYDAAYEFDRERLKAAVAAGLEALGRKD